MASGSQPATCWQAFAGTPVKLATIGRFSPDCAASLPNHCMAQPPAVEKPPEDCGKYDPRISALHGLLALISLP
jgi:hypothetical protein